jgi:hypothetical protein
MLKPYVVYTPPMKPTSGGIRVMWGLFGHLLAKGMVAYVNTKLSTHNFIGIYPEIMHGNEGEADHVVRYVLNKPGVMGYGTPGTSLFKPGPTVFDQTDEIYYFSHLFGMADESHYMFLPILSMKLFNLQDKRRTKTCVFVGKGHDLHEHPKDVVYITKEVTNDQEELADLLNECQVMYCYDPITAMTEIARLCGCRIVMINPVYSKDEFSKYEAGMNGMSWGKDEGIKLDVAGFREHYNWMKRTFGKKLDIFIERTQR